MLCKDFQLTSIIKKKIYDEKLTITMTFCRHMKFSYEHDMITQTYLFATVTRIHKYCNRLDWWLCDNRQPGQQKNTSIYRPVVFALLGIISSLCIQCKGWFLIIIWVFDAFYHQYLCLYKAICSSYLFTLSCHFFFLVKASFTFLMNTEQTEHQKITEQH